MKTTILPGREPEALQNTPAKGYSAGFNEIQEALFRACNSRARARVLIVGAPGSLACRLADTGSLVTVVDSSAQAMEQGREAAPRAEWLCADFFRRMPLEVLGKCYDFILCLYSLNRLPAREQVSLLKKLHYLLENGGKILAGGVVFQTEQEAAACLAQLGEAGGLIPGVLSQWERELPFPYKFRRVSFCAGILEAEKPL